MNWSRRIAGTILAAIAAMSMVTEPAIAGPAIGANLKIGFSVCPSLGCGVIEQIEVGRDFRVHFDAWHSFPTASGIPHRLLETGVDVVYDPRVFGEPRAVVLPGQMTPASWWCQVGLLAETWATATCSYRDAGGTPYRQSDGMTVLEAPELAIDLLATGETGSTSVAFEPQPDGVSSWHRNQIAGVLWLVTPDAEEPDEREVRLGEWRALGEPMDVEIVAAPEPSSSAMAAVGTAMLVALARRRERRCRA